MNIILIPAYKPEESFVVFSKELLSHNHKILVVNDGSGSEFDEIFKRVETLGVTVTGYGENHGKGYALKTGFAYIMENFPDADTVVTADCDGQHSVKDIENIVRIMGENPDTFIIGGRFSTEGDKVPFKSKLGNDSTRIAFRLATGLKIRDTQTGLRGIPKKLFPEMLTLPGERYEYEMNMLLYLKRWNCAYMEIPIQTIYINDNKGTHYNAIRDTARIFAQLLKFCGSSMVCFLLDYVLFWLFNKFILHGAALFGFSCAYILARVFSAVANYFLNRKVVFKNGTKTSALKYLLLAVCVMIVGSFFTNLLNVKLGIPAIVCKLIIDVPLYFANYFIQREWVFEGKKK